MHVGHSGSGVNRIGHRSKQNCVLQTGRKDFIPMDRSPYSQKMTNYGSSWQLDGRKFDGSDDYCYDNMTEVLTLGGWKLFKDLSYSDSVATLNPETEELEYQTPSKIISYSYKGKMFQIINSNQIDLCVIPEHRMWVSIYKSSNEWYPYQLIPAKDIYDKFIRYKKDALWDGVEKRCFTLPGITGTHPSGYPDQLPKNFLMDDWLAFFGFWVSEGCVYWYKNSETEHSNYQTIISQNKDVNPDTWQDITDCLENLGLKYSYSGCNFHISSKQLWSYLKQFGKATEKYIPDEFKELSTRQLTILFDAMMKGDGHENCYYTSSKRLADDVQEILLKIGKSGNITISYQNKNPLYTIHVQTSHTRPRVGKPREGHETAENKWVEYNDAVYSCEVQNHIIYVRRNGKACWSGNCDAGNAPSLDITSVITIGAWVNPLTQASSAGIVSKDDAGANRQYNLQIDIGPTPDTFLWRIWQSNGVGKAIAPPLGTGWQHFVGVADGSYVRAYINGVSVGTPVAYDGTIRSIPTQPVRIGFYAVNFFNGSIDEVCIYNRAEFHARITQNTFRRKPGIGG